MSALNAKGSKTPFVKSIDKNAIMCYVTPKRGGLRMKNITSELETIAPERMQTLRKINKMMRTGSIKEFSIDEQIEMSGVMAEAAAAFYFSDTVKNEMESVRLDLYEATMLVAADMIKDPTREHLSPLTDTSPEDNIWEKFEDAYIEYYVRKYRSAKGLDDADVIGEYPPPDENGYEDE